MSTTISWHIEPTVSAVYAAAVLLKEGRLTDQPLENAIQPSASALKTRLETLSDSPHQALNCIAAAFHSPQDASDRLRDLLRGLGVPSERGKEELSWLMDHIKRLDQLTGDLHSDLQNELELRSRPLRQLWEARGPGLLRSLQKLTMPAFVPAESRVLVVKPVAGGGGACCSELACAMMEGMLANPIPEIPEVVRLGWLLAQIGAANVLHQDSTSHQDQESLDDRHQLIRTSLIPATLEAAEDVELCRFDQLQLALALDVWKACDDPGCKGRSAL